MREKEELKTACQTVLSRSRGNQGMAEGAQCRRL